MTDRVFRSALRMFTRRPQFRPFIIEYASGSRLVVTHREAVRRYEADESDSASREVWYGYVSPSDKWQFFQSSSVSRIYEAEE